jgi:uncharacterized membrane protein YdbT with pleckstrin-like domain
MSDPKSDPNSDNERPRGYLGKLLATGEDVLLIELQHSFVAFRLIVGALIYTVAVLVSVSLLWARYGEGRNWIAYSYILALLGLPNLLWRLTVWRAHQYIVTSRRVIQISGVFTKAVIDSALDKVTDVRTEQTLLGRVFKYGDVEVLTASETGKNLFRMIADPLAFKRAIMDAQQELFRPTRGRG